VPPTGKKLGAGGTPDYNELWMRVVDLAATSPIALASLAVSYVAGHAFYWLIMGYRTERPPSTPLCLCIGIGYASLVYMVTGGYARVASKTPVTFQEVVDRLPVVTVLGMAVLFIVLVVVMIIRERRLGTGGHGG
jgi:hypothetical protein